MATTLKLTPQVGNTTLTQEWLEEAGETGETDTYSRKYRDPRTTWNVPLEVHVPVRGGLTETYYATSIDVSEGGIGFRCREMIPPHTRVRICRDGEMVGVTAVTLGSTQSLAGYLIGARFDFEAENPVPKASKAG